MEWIARKAQGLGHGMFRDNAGNLLVAMKGKKASPPELILQAHVDMVEEKNARTLHDFLSDPVFLLRDGEWIRARGTTLGADNGIGVAMMLALMETPAPSCGLGLLFTVDEECGLTGAMGLDPALLGGARYLVNLDGEEEGIIYAGCAGGRETRGTTQVALADIPADHCILDVAVKGLRGGHSGADIHLQRANSLKLLVRILDEAFLDPAFAGGLISLEGGDKHNAIPREARARLYGPRSCLADLSVSFRNAASRIADEFGADEADFRLEIGDLAGPSPVRGMTLTDSRRVLDCLRGMPHGVQDFSRTIHGLVSTSTNLARVRTGEGTVDIVTSQRSDRQDSLDSLCRTVSTIFRLAGFTASSSRGYPAWTPRPDSDLASFVSEKWYRAAGQKPVITSIHAGLECGVIGEKIPGLPMISFGPDIRDVHTPDEKVSIPSVERFWKILSDMVREWDL